jgi:hypothetical protein
MTPTSVMDDVTDRPHVLDPSHRRFVVIRWLATTCCELIPEVHAICNMLWS